jgi:ribosomal protein L11 methyltransferase
MNYTEVDFVLNPLLPAREVLIAELSELPFESFVETATGVKAYCPEPDFDASWLPNLLVHQMEDQTVDIHIKLIEDENWNAQWESNFDPIWIGDQMIIRAPFHESPKQVTYDLIIEPKMSFGTGHHATTYLVAEAMLEMEMNDLDVLDMGSGTGVLGILASKKGARSVVAIDIDEWAYENIQENNQRNATQMTMLLGGAELLPQVASYDLVLANINRNILTRDMPFYSHCMREGAHILFSGFYTQDASEIEACATVHGLTCIRTNSKDDWQMMVFQKK